MFAFGIESTMAELMNILQDRDLELWQSLVNIMQLIKFPLCKIYQGLIMLGYLVLGHVTIPRIPAVRL